MKTTLLSAVFLLLLSLDSFAETAPKLSCISSVYNELTSTTEEIEAGKTLLLYRSGGAAMPNAFINEEKEFTFIAVIETQVVGQFFPLPLTLIIGKSKTHSTIVEKSVVILAPLMTAGIATTLKDGRTLSLYCTR